MPTLPPRRLEGTVAMNKPRMEMSRMFLNIPAWRDWNKFPGRVGDQAESSLMT